MIPGTRVAYRTNRGDSLAHLRSEGLIEEVSGTVVQRLDDEHCLVRFHFDGRAVVVAKVIQELTVRADLPRL
jgi:hypothetical protein